MSRVWNQTGLHPVGHAVLCEPYEPDTKSRIVLPPSVAENKKVIETKVRILEVGPASWPNEKARAAAGDLVMVSRYAGVMVQSPVDGHLYKVVNDNDIFCKFDEQGNRAEEAA